MREEKEIEIEREREREREKRKRDKKWERYEGEERQLRERTSLTSRPLRISFTVTDIRHGQRSSSRRRRRNRETKKKEKETEAQDEQKSSRHAWRAHGPYFSSSRCLLFLLLLLLLLFFSVQLVLYIVDRLDATLYIAGKKRTPIASRLFLFNGRGQNKPPPTATPISSRHDERDFERSSITQPV